MFEMSPVTTKWYRSHKEVTTITHNSLRFLVFPALYHSFRPFHYTIFFCCKLYIYSFIHLFIYSFIRSSTYLYIYLFIYLFLYISWSYFCLLFLQWDCRVVLHPPTDFSITAVLCTVIMDWTGLWVSWDILSSLMTNSIGAEPKYHYWKRVK